MAILKDAFKDLNVRHADASRTNNLKVIAGLVDEYENLLNQAPEELSILFGLGTCKLQLGMNGSAIMYFQQAIQSNNKLPELWNNLGSAWKAENRNDEARQCFEKALSLKDDPDYYNNLATLHVNEGRPDEGIEYAEKGIALNPEHPRLRWNYSLLLLEKGRWKEGFENYDYGLLSLDRPNRFYSDKPEDVPIWNGEKGRVVVYGEQGMGDEIMFASAIPDLIADIGRENVIFDCHERMVSLFERSFGVTCYGTRKNEDISWPLKDKPDYRIAIGSLFGRYRKDGKFPKTRYLKADPELVKHYREKLEATGPGPYVGLGWQAGYKKTRQDLRSFKLKQFLPVLEQGGTFVSLQYTEGSEDKVARFKEDTGHDIHHWTDVVQSKDPEGNEYTGFDYDHTVALIEALDLCILPNTSSVHVCGAIGADCWTLTPKAAAWRYQLKGNFMPMYGSWVRQIREREDWKDAFKRAARDYGWYLADKQKAVGG